MKALAANISLPLYSPDSKWSTGSTLYVAEQTIRLFEDGDEVSRFEKDQILASAFVKRSFGKRFHKRNVKLKLKYNEADYSPLGSATTTPPPRDQANITPIIGFSTEDIRWVKNTYIDKMGIVEDDWLGVRSGASGGYGIPVGDGFELWDVGGYVAPNFAFRWEQLLLMSAVATSEIVRNTIVVGKIRYYKKFEHHTVALHAKTKLGYELDSSRQFQLGADSGLRGYPARKFTGDKLLLFNLEDRQFWGTIPWGMKIAVGTVVFVDTGNAWTDNADFDMKWSAGGGIRLGFSNLPKQPIFRMDFGSPIAADGFAITLGTEQQF